MLSSARASARAGAANGLGDGMPTSTVPEGPGFVSPAGAAPGVSFSLRRLNKRTSLLRTSARLTRSPRRSQPGQCRFSTCTIAAMPTTGTRRLSGGTVLATASATPARTTSQRRPA